LRPTLEALEDRALMSHAGLAALHHRAPHARVIHHRRQALQLPPGTALAATGMDLSDILLNNAHLVLPAQPKAGSLTPAQIRHAYGFDRITFTANGQTVAGDGSGQTIAIIVAGDNPRFVNTGDPNFAGSDLHQFDVQFGLPDPPSFRKVAADGSQDLPPPRADSPFPLEIALDVEWAHAIAPAAGILLVEAPGDPSTTIDFLMDAVRFARQQPDVSVVSMSFGDPEGFNHVPEPTFDNLFVTPPGHQGITFVASSGDFGNPNYPAVSPNVLAVGGTSLEVDAEGNYLGETAWSGAANQSASGGGIANAEPLPAYQSGVVPLQTVQDGSAVRPFNVDHRASPDVAYNADGRAGHGIALLDSFDHPDDPWSLSGGTSAGAPQWAALVAIADQGRQLQGEGRLDGTTQTLPLLYALPASDFHDVTDGHNGNGLKFQGPDGSPGLTAGAGYDLMTGLGSPVADRVVQDLVSSSTALTGGVVTAFADGTVTFSPDGRHLGGNGGATPLYAGPQQAVALLPYRGGLLTAFANGEIHFRPGQPGGVGDDVLVAPAGEPVRALVPYGTGVLIAFPHAIDFSPDGKSLGTQVFPFRAPVVGLPHLTLVGGTGLDVHLPPPPEVVNLVPYDGGILTVLSDGTSSQVLFSPDGQNLGGGGNTFRVYSGSQRVVSMVPFGDGMLVAFSDGTIDFNNGDPSGWHLGADAGQTQVFAGPQQVVSMVAYAGGVLTAFTGGQVLFSPDGRNLGGGGNTVRVFAGSILVPLQLPPSPVVNLGPTSGAGGLGPGPGVILPLVKMAPYHGGILAVFTNGTQTRVQFLADPLTMGSDNAVTVYSGDQQVTALLAGG
jgi:hypothetical protein